MARSAHFALVLFALVSLAAPGAAARAHAAAGSALTRPTWTVDAGDRDRLLAQAEASPRVPETPAPSPAAYTGPSPATAALRSLVLPGWGQLATGHKTQAGIFLGLEAASWASYITYQRQGHLREDSYLETARRYAGIDLESQDESLRKLVGQYQSNDVYNQYVVMREAAYFIDDPAEQEAYIAAHSLDGAESWSWTLYEDFLRYREERRSSEAAYHNSEFVLGFAIVNRLVSAVMAARQASSQRKAAQAGATSGLGAVPDTAPAPGQPNGRLVWGVAPSMQGPLEGRVGWIVTF